MKTYTEKWAPRCYKTIIRPPNTAHTVIKPHLYEVEVINPPHKRFYGFELAHIDSYLRVRVSGYDIGFSEVNNWENAPSY